MKSSQPCGSSLFRVGKIEKSMSGGVKIEHYERYISFSNSLVQAAKARARGYRTTHNLIAMIYLIGGKLNFGLPI